VGSEDQVDAGAVTGGQAGLTPRLSDASDWGFDVAEPARLRLGLAHRFGSASWVPLDLNARHEMTNRVFGIDRGWLFKARLGGRFAVDDGVAAGVGLFTDLDPGASAASEFLETRLDFFGVTVGVEYSSVHQLADDEDTNSVAFRTSVAVRYALGVGELGGLAVRFCDPTLSQDLVKTVPVDFTFHELGLHLGSALYFCSVVHLHLERSTAMHLFR
jgi:hypothetical protein